MDTNTSNALTTLLINTLSQMPTVLILVIVMYYQTRSHQASIAYYRTENAALISFIAGIAAKATATKPPELPKVEPEPDPTPIIKLPDA